MYEDACVYIRRRGTQVTLLLLYVDDITSSASNKGILEELVLYLQSLFSLKLMLSLWEFQQQFHCQFQRSCLGSNLFGGKDSALKMANGPIRWKWALSQEILLSTCEAEVRVVAVMLEPFFFFFFF